MYRIITPDAKSFPVSLEWTDMGGKRLLVATHPRSAGWTANALRAASEITVESTGPGPWKVDRTATSFTVSCLGSGANGCVFVKILDFNSLPFNTTSMPEND